MSDCRLRVLVLAPLPLRVLFACTSIMARTSRPPFYDEILLGPVFKPICQRIPSRRWRLLKCLLYLLRFLMTLGREQVCQAICRHLHELRKRMTRRAGGRPYSDRLSALELR